MKSWSRNDNEIMVNNERRNDINESNIPQWRNYDNEMKKWYESNVNDNDDM